MNEYNLSKSKKNELTNVNESNKPVQVSKGTKIIPKKNYLVQVTNGTIALCIETGKGLIKITNKALTIIGNKIKEVDWGKVTLFLLKNFFFTTQKTNNVYYRQIKTYTVREEPIIQENSYRENPYQEQIQGTKTESLKVNKTKEIANKEQKQIKNNRSNKSIENKQNKNIIKPQENYLMIEKQNKQKKEK